jgi:8-oxo-dGTP diphosphatase
MRESGRNHGPVLDYTEYDTRLAAYALITETIDGRERILLTLWNEGPRPLWGLPGGGVEFDESIE